MEGGVGSGDADAVECDALSVFRGAAVASSVSIEAGESRR